MSIWVVDDDEAILVLLTRALERDGHSVRTFSSVVAALQALGDGARPEALPEICLMDWTLRDGSAMDVANVMPKSVKLVIMSGDPDVKFQLKHGMEWIEKPFQLSHLSRVLVSVQVSPARLALGRPLNEAWERRQKSPTLCSEVANAETGDFVRAPTPHSAD